MAIKNPNHVRGVRDGVHAGIQAFALSAGLGNNDIDGTDCCTGIAMALRDIIQSAPDSFTRARLSAQVIEVMKEAATRPVIVPATSMPAKVS